MARFKVTTVYEFGMDDPHTASDWEVYKSKDANGVYHDLLFKSTDDKVYLNEIICTLKEGDGTLYDPYRGTAARVRFHYNEAITKWHDAIECHDRLGLEVFGFVMDDGYKSGHPEKLYFRIPKDSGVFEVRIQIVVNGVVVRNLTVTEYLQFESLHLGDQEFTVYATGIKRNGEEVGPLIYYYKPIDRRDLPFGLPMPLGDKFDPGVANTDDQAGNRLGDMSHLPMELEKPKND